MKEFRSRRAFTALALFLLVAGAMLLLVSEHRVSNHNKSTEPNRLVGRQLGAFGSVDRDGDRADGGSTVTVVIPTSLGSVRYVGNNGVFYSRYPMGPCMGDCDSDVMSLCIMTGMTEDCAEGLYCYDRAANDPVPFCDGGEFQAIGYDVCAWNTSLPQPASLPQLPVGAFHIKLYWEEGYYWQNETLDREWCMISNFDGYPGSGVCWYGLEESNCTASQLYIGKCLLGDERQWFTFENLGSTYSGSDDHTEVLIKTLDNRCLYRHASDVYLAPYCDPEDPLQRFFALNGTLPLNGPEPGNKFEIGQYQGYTLDNCLTNAHHPKSGEVIEFHVCEHARAHDDQTSYWELLQFPSFVGSLSNVARRRSGNGFGVLESNNDGGGFP
ncbi:expressed unknown protein [Seminavis robusta]|uniref:Uncharacterized protein n=1 Tax=Seminavis robusta TaxID=568900 RepID=A0A9N8E937_9STRA|nr:expressed unknown protein [Seminavis robusta]|eukprot:Sro808_g205500.1 n/a (383) ;mRNA; f:42027-43615